MTIAIVHLSDLHFRVGSAENHAMVLDALMMDLKKQIAQMGEPTVYLAFSGDIAQAGDDTSQYADLAAKVDETLNQLGITKDFRIFAPGNHDASEIVVRDKLTEHEAVLSNNLSENDFNDYIQKRPSTFFDKFPRYLSFAAKYAVYQAKRGQRYLF